MLGEIPKQDDVVHAGRSNILAGGMQIEGHDGLFMAFEGSDKAGVLFVMHELCF